LPCKVNATLCYCSSATTQFKLHCFLIVHPAEPVANFHMSNGAEFHRVNYMGNPSLAGLRASVGMMVNYLYRLDALEQNAQLFARPNSTSEAVRGGAQQQLPLGPTVREILNVI